MKNLRNSYWEKLILQKIELLQHLGFGRYRNPSYTIQTQMYFTLHLAQLSE